MADDLHTTVLTVARQAAREAVARLLEDRGHGPGVAAETRAGKHDSVSAVRDALAGADAAVSAALPVIVRAAAGVATDEAVRLRENAAALWEMDCDNSEVVRQRYQMALTAGEIHDSILALIREDSVSLSQVGRMVAALHEINEAVADAHALIPETTP